MYSVGALPLTFYEYPRGSLWRATSCVAKTDVRLPPVCFFNDASYTERSNWHWHTAQWPSQRKQWLITRLWLRLTVLVSHVIFLALKMQYTLHVVFFRSHTGTDTVSFHQRCYMKYPCRSKEYEYFCHLWITLIDHFNVTIQNAIIVNSHTAVL